jgi:hypothetical protein
MVSLTGHAHEGCAPAATAWVRCAGAAVVLGMTTVLASLQAWDRGRGVYRSLARICAAAAVTCLVAAAAWPAPLLLAVALGVLLSIRWGLAVARRLTN